MTCYLPARCLTFAAALALALPGAAHALEQVTLRSGFTYDCARHVPVAEGRVRLYLEASSDASYVELPGDEIVRVDTLPDPPKVVVATEPSAATAAAAATEDVRELLAHAGEQHNIDVDLLASVIRAESGGRAQAVSRTGAQGLMQLMPSTAHSLGVNDAFKPSENINGGTAYLDALLTRYHDNLALALAAYNAGPGAVDKYHGVPPYAETRAYVVRVMREFKRRKQAETAGVKLASR